MIIKSHVKDTYKDDPCQISDHYDNVAKSWCFLRDFAKKKDFSLYKGNSRDFEGKMSGSGQFFDWYKFVLIFSERTHRNDALV